MYESFDQKFQSLEEMKNWQESKLLSFVNYALDNCKFYKKNGYPNKIQNITEFDRLPFFSGDEFRDNNLDFFTNQTKLWRVFATSGTTGKPKLSFYGNDLIKSYVIGIGDMLTRTGIDIKDPKNVGCVMFPMGALTGSGPATARALEGLNIPVVTLGIDIAAQFALSIIEKMKPNFIFMYPSVFSAFSDEIEKAGCDIKKLGVKVIFSSGEPLTQNMRDYIKEKWNADVFNLIGSVDVANFTGSECKKHNGFHILPYNCYFEIVDDVGKKIKEGQGELVLTTLVNNTMPLVRYRTKDIFEYSEEVCECGSILPRIWFKSRKDDMIILTGAAKLFPYDIIQVVNRFSDLTSDYQIEIRTLNGKDKLIFTFESRTQSEKLIENIIEALCDISSLSRKIKAGTALKPEVKLVPINSLERRRGKLKNRILDLRSKI